MYLPNNAMELVGRSQESDRLRTLLGRVQQGKGQVVLINGDAGIGKTRLLASLIDLAQQNDFTVIRGECNEQDQDFPYGPIIDGLRTHFSGATSAELQRIIGPFQPEMVRLLPELALRMASPPSLAPLEPEAEKRRLFEVLIQIYQHLAASGLLLIFEDIHWCDTNSLEFFQTITRRISNLPIMVTLSSRLTAPDSAVAKLRLYFDRAENAQSILLNPLTEAEVEHLARSVLQTTDPMHPALLESLNTLAQGNPLYTEQLVYMLLQNRQLSVVNGTWMITSSTRMVKIPASIAQTVEQQMERLSEDARQVLQFAAVAGRQFELNVLQSLMGYDEARLTGLVKALIDKRFFEEVSRDRFAFRHALLRQAIYDGLLIRERQALHQSLLHILEESDPKDTGTSLAELSYHAYQAQAWEAALQYGFQAGQHALSLHSPRAAVEHFSHAVEASNQLGKNPSWDLFMQRGKAFDYLGEFQPALNDYESALNVAEGDSDQEAVWQTLIAIALLWASHDYRRTEEYCYRALQVAQAIEEPRLIGHSLNRLGNWYLNTGQPFEALNYHQQALAVFDELDDLAGKGETLDLLGMTSGHVLQLPAQQRYYQDAVGIFRTLDDRMALASTLANLALCTLNSVMAEEAIAIAHQIGWYSGEAYACVTTGYVYSFYGQFTQSLSHLHRSQELAQAIDHTQWLAGAHIFSAFVYRDLLELETATDQVEQGIALATAVGSHWYSAMGQGLLAQIHIEQGHLDRAGELLSQCEVSDPPVMQYAMTMLAEIDLALARGDAQTALSASERVWQVWSLDRDGVSLSAFVIVPGLVAQARATAMVGHHAEALEMLERARNVCEKQGLLPNRLRVDILLGQIAAQNDPAKAEGHFQQARDAIDQLDEHIPEDLRQRFRDNVEKRISAGRRHPKPAISRHQLTRRETDVAREIALGKTNQQIADDLHITIKTVETHITRVLSKLNLTSRTQIALWAVEHKLIQSLE
jgi:DNA-binding NarL/FixJ family response regulator